LLFYEDAFAKESFGKGPGLQVPSSIITFLFLSAMVAIEKNPRNCMKLENAPISG